MIEIFRKKKMYCPSMYIGYNGDYRYDTKLCAKTGEKCICYEEAIVEANEFIKYIDSIEEEKIKDRDWTKMKVWRLSLGLLMKCPSNKNRKNLQELIDAEKDITNRFFNGEPISSELKEDD